MLPSLFKRTSKTLVLFFRNGKVLNYTWCAICKCFGQDHSPLKPHCRGQGSHRYLFSDGCHCLTDFTLVMRQLMHIFPKIVQPGLVGNLWIFVCGNPCVPSACFSFGCACVPEWRELQSLSNQPPTCCVLWGCPAPCALGCLSLVTEKLH